VTTTFKARTDELVKSVQQTDWRSELMAFSKEAAEEGKTLSHKAAEVVEHLPEVVAPMPEQAGKVARDLPIPGNQEVQETILQVGDTLKGFGQSLLVGTKELIEQLRDGVETEIAVATRETKRAGRAAKSAAAAAKLAAAGPAGKYKRFEAEVAAMQRDSATYCDEPADTEDFAKWKSGFSLTAAQPDIDRLLADNAFMAELQARIVPIIVEKEDFWHRYFYRLHKLQAKEDARTQLAQRAKARIEEEDVAWDDDGDTAAATGAGAGEAGSGGGSADAAGATSSAADPGTAADDGAAAGAAALEAVEAEQPVPLPSMPEEEVPVTAGQDAAEQPEAASEAAEAGPAKGGEAEVAPAAASSTEEPPAPPAAPAAAPPAPAAAQARASSGHSGPSSVSVNTPTSTDGGSGDHAEHDAASVSSKGDWCMVPGSDAASGQSAVTTTSGSVLAPKQAGSPDAKSAAPSPEPAPSAAQKDKPSHAAAAKPAAASSSAPAVAVGVAAAAVAAAASPAKPVAAPSAGAADTGGDDSGGELDKEDEAWGDWD